MSDQMEKWNTNNNNRLNEVIKRLAQKLGANLRTGGKDDPNNPNGALRVLTDNRRYMAVTRPEENLSEGYSGLSFVIFPLKEESTSAEEVSYTCVVSICIGTSDLGEDEELAALPYLRRSYTKLIPLEKYKEGDKRKEGFIKTSFTDTVTESVALFDYLEKNKDAQGWNLSEIVKYRKLLPAAILLSFKDKDIEDVFRDIDKGNELHCSNDFVILAAWLAQYAKIRGWEFRNNNNNRFNLQDNLITAVAQKVQKTDDEVEKKIAEIL